MSDLAFIIVPTPPRKERNYYADLELPGRVDDIEVIKKQYKKLALLKHPDRGGNIDEFKIISDAYAFLMDPESGPTEKFFPNVCKMLRDLGIAFESITLGPQEPDTTHQEERREILGYTPEMNELQNGEPPPLTFVFESGEVEEFPPIPKEWLDSSAHGQEDQLDDGGDTGDI